MKKFLSLILALVMVCSLSVTAFAEEGTTTLTVEVPNAAEPSYTLHIPADTTLTYGDTAMQLISGRLYVSDVQIQDAKDILFTARYTDLVNTADSGDEIPMKLFCTMPTLFPDETHMVNPTSGYVSGFLWSMYHVYGNDSPDANVPMEFRAQVEDWTGATPGATYQAVITFQVWAGNDLA